MTKYLDIVVGPYTNFKLSDKICKTWCLIKWKLTGLLLFLKKKKGILILWCILWNIMYESKSYKAKRLGAKIEDFGKVYGEKEKSMPF